MNNKKIIASTFAVLFIALMLASPVYACTKPVNLTTKIPFTITVYFVGAVPGETTTIRDIIITKGGTSQAITLDGTLVSDNENIYKFFNTATNKGYGIGTFVDTYTNSIIGTGVIKGISYSKITSADGSTGTCSIVAYGSTDKYSYIKEVSTASWQPTNTPFPTVMLTVTGYYIVKS